MKLKTQPDVKTENKTINGYEFHNKFGDCRLALARYAYDGQLAVGIDYDDGGSDVASVNLHEYGIFAGENAVMVPVDKMYLIEQLLNDGVVSTDYIKHGYGPYDAAAYVVKFDSDVESEVSFDPR